MTIAGSLQDPLIGQTFGHYRIIELIGAGGMGKVYRAADAHLDREVAIKVLPFGILADEKSRHRFRKEALTLSKLNHPNIATIYDFDSQRDLDFLAMEYISGVTLNDRLAHGSLPEKQVIALGVQLAEGLAAAHDHGIIHRDLKPGNLRLNAEGRLKILDFGLAKLRDSASLGTVSETLSEASDMAGTLPYMAPEQIVGGELDPRTDIHATGAVLYEMATGQRAFPRMDRSQLTAAILRTNPRPADAVNPRLSPELARIISKCLEKEPEHRYQSAKELSIDLHRLERSMDGISSTSEVASSSRAEFFANRRSRNILLLFGAVLLVSSVVLIIRHFRDQKKIEQAGPASIAVLPFVDMSPTHDQEYFSDGLAEEILNTLASIPGLKVAGRTSSFQFKGKNEDLRAIGQKLSVAYVLEGSVRKDGNHVRITAQLIKTADGYHVWSDTYDRNVSDIFTLQDGIAEAVTDALKLHLDTEPTMARPQFTRTAKPEAFQSFLQARYFSRLTDSVSSRKALDYATRSIDLDPTYVPAYSLRADVLIYLGGMGWMDFAVAIADARRDADKVIALAPQLPDGYRLISKTQAYFDSNCPAAEQSLHKARELAPSDPETLSFAGVLSMCQGRIDEAVALTQQALVHDPLRLVELTYLGQYYRDLGQFAEARNALHRALDLDPHDVVMAHEVLGEIDLLQGDPKSALLEMQKEPPGYLRELGLNMAYQALGQHKEADDALARMIAQYSTIAMYQIAQVYANRGDADNTFRALNRAYELHDPGLLWFKTDLRMKTFHSDPRYQDLLRRLHLA